MTRPRSLAALAAILALVPQVAARATTHVFPFNIAGLGGSTLSASGQFLADSDAAAPHWVITGVTGTADGRAITGLSLAFSANNLLDLGGTAPLVDSQGISFTTAGGPTYNVYFFGGPLEPVPYYQVVSGLPPIDPGSSYAAVEVRFVVAMPEPAIALLLGAGLLGLGTLRRRGRGLFRREQRGGISPGNREKPP